MTVEICAFWIFVFLSKRYNFCFARNDRKEYELHTRDATPKHNQMTSSMRKKCIVSIKLVRTAGTYNGHFMIVTAHFAHNYIFDKYSVMWRKFSFSQNTSQSTHIFMDAAMFYIYCAGLLRAICVFKSISST